MAIVAYVVRFEAKSSQFILVASFDSLIGLKIRSDAYISRSGNFHANNNRRTN